ncbi:MAG TPA: hypothetical protein VLC48_00365, partial [Gemmatimonadota bacterium]|nr:hypothetical protein [Gemmatimonadota bacterium]
MRSRTAATVAGTLAILIVACGEPPQGLDPTQVLALGKGRAAACPTPADYVVTDQEEFIAAVDAASPGEVVGIDGMI